VLLEIKEFSHDSMVTTNLVQRDHCLTRFIGSSWVPYSVRIFTFTEAPSRSCNSSRSSSCNFESKTSRRKCNKKGFSVSLHCVRQQQITLYTSSAEQHAFWHPHTPCIHPLWFNVPELIRLQQFHCMLSQCRSIFGFIPLSTKLQTGEQINQPGAYAL
jgi:hypothetical protein